MVGRIAWAHRTLARARSGRGLPWQLRALPVCASTERELDQWLRQVPPLAGPRTPGAALPAAELSPGPHLRQPRAVLARRQCFGHGQQGRVWVSPPGGVWLSAALPWPEDPEDAASPALAVAVALAAELVALGVPIGLKWPNDLMLLTPAGPRKLAGLLPGLRLRGGKVRWARIGIGLNGCNPVPTGAAALLGFPRTRASRGDLLAARVLLALDRAMELATRPEAVRSAAEGLLLPLGPLDVEGEPWQPLGLAVDGGLRILNAAGHHRILRRF
ncbi:MAG: biotin--[acetyl-CoA-carboxylase] ligase [Cyanobacteria bacterium]|nr:biotin--[acetyl-CoA-carboxylase] ligase [Cyanobacteriota bacterium]